MGYSYNLAACLLIALMVSLAWTIVSLFVRTRLTKLVLVAAVVAGGTGVTPFIPMLQEQGDKSTPDAQVYKATTRLWMSVRFIGMYEERVNTEFGRRLLYPDGGKVDPKIQDLPLETIAYLIFVGDYHSPLGGFLLLMVAVACLALLERKPLDSVGKPALGIKKDAPLQAVFVATGPLMLLTNAWVVPLQAGLIGSWIIYRWLRGQRPNWVAILLGGIIPLLLAYPFLRDFTANALALPIRLVEATQHTPLTHWLLMLWPQLLLLLLGFFIGRREPLAWLWIGFGALLLGLSELIYVDDPMGGKFNRFNTTLKWWSWLHLALLLALGSMLLGARQRWVRGLTIAVLVSLASYSVEMTKFWLNADKPAFGKMHGHHWLSANGVNAEILSHLQDSPPGIVLEGIDRLAYSPTSAFALFANKTSLTGWPQHESIWRGNPEFIGRTGREAVQFYKGTLIDSLEWLNKHQVAYIVWQEQDQKRFADGWNKIQNQIEQDYAWLSFYQLGQVRYGIWLRKQGSE